MHGASPARRTAAPPVTFAVRIAEVDVAFEWEDPEPAEAPPEAWTAFLIPTPQDATRIRVRGRPGAPVPGGQQKIPTCSVAANGDRRFAADGFEAVLSADGRGGRLALTEGADRSAVDFALRAALCARLSSAGGLVAHAAGIATPAGAALFPAHSEGGKSTLSRVCSDFGLRVVADELVALRPAARGFEAFATPWHFSSCARAPIRRVGLLGFAPETSLGEVGPSEVLRMLLDNVYLPDTSPGVRRAAFDTASKLVDGCPLARLRFAPNDSAVRAVKAWLDAPLS